MAKKKTKVTEVQGIPPLPKEVKEEVTVVLKKSTEAPEIARLPVESSTIAALGHDGDTLVIEFKSGPVWSYTPISKDTYLNMLDSDSLGRYFHLNIKYNREITATRLA